METTASATPADCFVMPRLINRGDVVNGHFCIGRSRDGVFYEFWSDSVGWCSAGMVYVGQDVAEAKLKEVNAMTVRHTEDGIGWDGLVPSKEERETERMEKRKACDRCGGDGKAHGSDRPFDWSGPETYPGPCPVCNGSGKAVRP